MVILVIIAMRKVLWTFIPQQIGYTTFIEKYPFNEEKPLTVLSHNLTYYFE